MKALHDLAILEVVKPKESRRCNRIDYKLGLDVHKRYSQVAALDEEGKVCRREKLVVSQPVSPRHPAAFETVGSWYWAAEAIEAAECQPRMAHAAKAKVRMGNVNKTDKLDAG